jgi:hypothetical protein
MRNTSSGFAGPGRLDSSRTANLSPGQPHLSRKSRECFWVFRCTRGELDATPQPTLFGALHNVRVAKGARLEIALTVCDGVLQISITVADPET